MTIAPVASPSFADDHSELQGLQLVPSPRVFTQPTPPPPLADLFANPSARALFGFDPVAIYSFLIFNAFVIYLVYIAVADRKDRLHGKQQAQLLRGKLAHRLDKELLAVLPDDQLHKAVVHLRKTDFKLKYGQLHHHLLHQHAHDRNNQTAPISGADRNSTGTQTTGVKPVVDPEPLEPVSDIPAPFTNLQPMPPPSQVMAVAATGGAVATGTGTTATTATTTGVQQSAMAMTPWGYMSHNFGGAHDPYQPSLALPQGWSSAMAKNSGNYGPSSWNSQKDPLNSDVNLRTKAVRENGQLSGLPQNFRLIVLGKDQGSSDRSKQSRVTSG